jgi:ankyrin repeat protein
MYFDVILLEWIRDGNIDVVQYAINNWADVNVKDKYGQTALDIAISEGNKEIVKILEDHIKSKEKTKLNSCCD